MKLSSRAAWLFLMMALNLFCSSCSKRNEEAHPNASFFDFYKAYAPTVEEESSDEEKDGKKISLSAAQMPFRDFVRWVSTHSQISIIGDENLDGKVISLEIVDSTVEDILQAAARRLGADMLKQGSVIYLGQFESKDRSMLVRKVRRLNSGELQAAIGVMATEVGRSTVFDDGLIIVADRFQVVQRINEMLDDIENAEANTWVIQYIVLSHNDRFAKEIGFDITNSFGISAAFSDISLSSLTADGVSIQAEFSAFLDASRRSSNARITASPLFLAVDGSSINFHQGRKYPIPRKTVSDSGTVTTSGYDYVDDGLTLVSTIRELSETDATLDIDFELSNISGYVDEVPIVDGTEFKSKIVIRSEGIYLVKSIEVNSNTRNSQGGFFSSLFAKDSAFGHSQIWVRVYRIDGEAIQKLGENPNVEMVTPH